MARLLLIHTGGTISMVPGPHGFEPRAGVAEQLARSVLGERLPTAELEICAFDPLLDSADIGPRHWNRLLDMIEAAEGAQDGIVVTHGTDSLAYSAAALALALGERSGRVVVTGAMRPSGSDNSDARDNLGDALAAACAAPPGVHVQFAGHLMAGDRVVKVSSVALDAFREIPRAPRPTPVRAAQPLQATRYADLRLAILTLSPGLSAEALDAMLAPLDGALLRCYGSGTMPADPRIRAVLQSRIEQGLSVMAISQCEEGGIRPGEYAAGALLRGIGVLDGADLTAEAAFAKLALLLSDSGAQPARPAAASARG